MTIKRTLCIIYLACISYMSVSQSYVDLATVTWDDGFSNDYNDGADRVRFYEINTDLTIPLVLNESQAIITGLQYEQVNLDFESSQPDIRVHGLALKLGLSTNHSTKWSGTYLLLPKISADKLNFKNRNLQFGAIVLLKKNLSPEQNIKFGFYSNTELFGPFIVPLLGYYKATETTEIKILAPLAAEFNYRIRPAITIGANFRGIIKSYQLNNQLGYLTKANNELGALVRLKIGKIIWQTIAGSTIGRNIRIYDDGDQLAMAVSALKFGDERTQLNNDLSDGIFIKSSLIVRFPTGS